MKEDRIGGSSESVLKGINRILPETVSFVTPEDFGRCCLSVLKDITQSRFAFLGEIGPDGLLHEIAVSGCDRDLCTTDDMGGHRRPPGKLKVSGPYEQVLANGKSFLTNEPAEHPDAIRAGHPPLAAFLGVPLIHEGRTFGMIGLANRKGGYRLEDLRMVEAIAPALLQILTRIRAGNEIFESYERLRELMNSLPVGVSFSNDAQCRSITGNRAVLAQFEMRPGDNLSASTPESGAPGRQVRYFLGKREVGGAELPLQRAVAEDRIISAVEIDIVLPSGRRWTAEASGAPIHDRKGNVVGGVAVTVDITERKRLEEALRALLAEKDILMRELIHRMKNNLQVIANLLDLQAAACSGDERIVKALADTRNRICAMAVVQENLYRSNNPASLNIGGYLEDLVHTILHAHRRNDGSVKPVLALDDFPVSIDTALPCGLILNELVSNSLKHAFPGRESGTIFLSLRKAGEQVELRYRDDGPGMPRSVDLSPTGSLGLKLVHNLAVHQLRGKMEVRRDPSTEFVFRFPADRMKESDP